MPMRCLRVLISLVSLLAIASGRLAAGDWPQILGPDRNGIAQNETLANDWPAGGPKKLWEMPVGAAYSGIAVAHDIAIVFHRVKNQEIIVAVKADTGEKLWSYGHPCRYRPQIEDSDGPRCVPVIAGGTVITFGVEGILSAWELKSGELLWRRDTHADFSPPDAYFGAGSTPLVDADRVLVNVGGRSQGGIVAFDLGNGKTLWHATNEAASYSSPIAVTVDGVRHALFITRLQFVSLDPASGRERFRMPFGARGPTVNAANPVMVGDDVLLTASYGIGAKLVAIGKDAAKIQWEGDTLSSQYATPIVYDGMVYGVDGRQDGGPVTLKCFDPATRDLAWAHPLGEYATLIAADGKLLIQQTDGVLRLAKLSADGYEELATAKLSQSLARALPALSGGRYYLRDKKTLRCYNLK
jgi:outer membrane protein assembly factor BamB